MSRNKNNQAFQRKFTDKMVASMVANALRIEYSESSSAIKEICRSTGVSLHTASKWYLGLNAPESGNLLMLAEAYPNVLRLILEMIGKHEIWDSYTDQDANQNGPVSIYKKSTNYGIYRDKFVPINVVVDSEVVINLNLRQLWFFGILQQGYKINLYDIVIIWKVSIKTAKRDISGLIDADLIVFQGAKKNGHYILK